MDLVSYGWTDFFDRAFAPHHAPGAYPARVAREERGLYHLYTASGAREARIRGALRHAARSRSDLPAVGDWVVVRRSEVGGPDTVVAVLPRRSRFSRKVAGSVTEEQVLAANVDTVFLMSALDRNYDLRRIERYVALAWESGAAPVVVLNKADLCARVDARVAEVEAVALGVPVLPVSATERRGLEALAPFLEPGQTVALLGSSGVGKSTLANVLLGEERLATAAVREGDDRGRHTTTRRELVPLPGGALLLDTPGMRELQLWSDGEGVDETFADIEELARECRFRDCRHDAEPGCAVRAAIEGGTLDPGRLAGYRKLQRELRHLAARQDDRLHRQERERSKRLSRWSRELEKGRRKGLVR